MERSPATRDEGNARKEQWRSPSSLPQAAVRHRVTICVNAEREFSPVAALPKPLGKIEAFNARSPLRQVDAKLLKQTREKLRCSRAVFARKAENLLIGSKLITLQ
jgi:hypothetical protein